MSVAGAPPGLAPRASGTAGGIALFLCALVLFAAYDAFAKHMVASHPPAVVNVSRYLAIAVLALALLLRRPPAQAATSVLSGVHRKIETCTLSYQ